ncbi:MAG: electron transfer flavoprotein subunit alpha/FixB family protein, partial [Anaerolineae bacterium]
ARVAPRLFLALGMDGDTSLFMSIQDAGLVVAVQPDPAAPIVSVADYNILADPVGFARAMLGLLT